MLFCCRLLGVELVVGGHRGGRGCGVGAGGHSGGSGGSGGLVGAGAVQQLNALHAQGLLALAVAVLVHVGGSGDSVHGLNLGAGVQQVVHAIGGVGRDEGLEVNPVDAAGAVSTLVVLPDSQAHENLAGAVLVGEDLGVAAQTADGDTEVTRISRHFCCPLSLVQKLNFGV